MSEQSVKVGDPKRVVFSSFETDQNPLSEVGTWRPRINTILTDFLVSGGKAIGKATGVGEFDDSAALLSGFGPDYMIIGTVFRGAGLNTGATHEVELLVRATQSEDISEQLECLFNFQGQIQFVQWFDNGGSQGFNFLTPDSGSESLGRGLVTGDRVKVIAEGDTFTLSVIDAEDVETVLGVYTSTAYPTGQPGIGSFTREGDGGDGDNFCFLDVLVQEL